MINKLPTEIKKLKYEIREYALEFGLDFFPIIFEVLDFDEMNEIASYGGFPNRYAHWRFGMEYEQHHKGYAYGLQKIYEMVINNNPCYAYLLKSNNIVDQKLVIAHVFAHCDFFKNNYCFLHTNRKMMDEMANHGTRIRNYIEKYGYEKVETFVDCCLSIENLIDYHSPFIKKRQETQNGVKDIEERPEIRKLKSKDYLDSFINPREYLEQQKQKLEELQKKKKMFPPEPEKDVLLFLLENSPLEPWQRDILSIVREESYYFAPQAMTKIMNEGWAVYWHSMIMTKRCLKDSEIIDYADHHSGTLAVYPGRINPYKIGVELFKDIEDRWDKGRFGKEYNDCDEFVKKQDWDMKLGIGREKIFEVRKYHNDITFIEEFLTPEFCRKNKLFTFKLNPRSGFYEIKDRDFENIKSQLLFALTNFGQPYIYVKDGNYKNRGELYIIHKHLGVDLQIEYAKDTLKSLFQIWGRPVNIETVVENKPVVYGYNGKEIVEENL